MLEAFTNEAGAYLFSNLEPGSYTLQQNQPANLKDGTDRFDAPAVVAAGNDRATINIPIAGNIDSRNNNFGERGLAAPFASMYDLLDSQFQRSSALLGTDGLSHWNAFLGAGWSGFSNLRVDLSAMTLTVRGAGGTDQVVNLRDHDASTNGTYMDRIMLRKQGVDEVILINGSAAEFGLTGQANPEGEGDLATVPTETSSGMYAQAVDQVFGSMA